MCIARLNDALRAIVEPHIPVRPRRLKIPGHTRVPDRAWLMGILFELLAGIQWGVLPKEMDFHFYLALFAGGC